MRRQINQVEINRVVIDQQLTSSEVVRVDEFCSRLTEPDRETMNIFLRGAVAATTKLCNGVFAGVNS